MWFGFTVSILLTNVRGEYYRYITAYIEAAVKLDRDRWNALAYNVPHLRLRVLDGRADMYFEDTTIPVRYLRLFMADSSPKETAARRKWNTSQRPAWAYDKIHNWLVEHKKIGAVATGPDSYPWIGDSFAVMGVYMLSAPVPNLNPDRVFASETELEQL